MARFTLPRDMYYGRGSIEALGNLRGRRAMLVRGAAQQRQDPLARARSALGRAGIDVRELEWSPLGTEAALRAGAGAMQDYAPDWIIAIGDGAVLGAAKLLWAFYEYPEATLRELAAPFRFPELRRKARMAAAPTTGGSAAEVTSYAWLAGCAYPFMDYGIAPDIAILDPNLAAEASPKQAAEAGMEALLYAVEAYASVQGSLFSDPLAQKAAETILSSLPPSAAGDAGARERMHYAQCLSGMAFSNAFLGAGSALLNALAAAFPAVPRGACAAACLIAAIRFNAGEPQALARYAALARALSLKGRTDAQLTDALCERIAALAEEVGAPRTLGAAGIAEDAFSAKLPELAQRAAADPSARGNPRAATAEGLSRAAWSAYRGE